MKKSIVAISFFVFLIGVTACTQTLNVFLPGTLTGTPSVSATQSTATKSTETPTPVPSTATPNQQTLEATTQMSIPQESTYEVIPLELEELVRWPEYEQALGAALFERLHFLEPKCEWQALGREENKLYLFAACSGYDQDNQGDLQTHGRYVVVYLQENGNIERVGTTMNTPGTWQEVNETLYPPEIREKFDHVPYMDELLQHLDDRRETPEPPWIVLYATSMP